MPGCRRQRRVPQLVSHRRQFGPALKRVGRRRVAHPVRRGPPQLLGKRGIRVGQDIGRCGEEPLHDCPQPLGRDADLAIEAAEQRRGGVPLRWRHGEAPLSQVPVQNTTRQPWQHHLAGLAAFADHVQPGIAVPVDLDGSKPGVHQFAGTQPGAVAEVDQEAKPLGCARLPTVRPLQPLGDRPYKLPLTLGKGSRRVQGRLPGAADLDAGEGIGQYVPLLDQPPEHRTQHGQRIGPAARGQGASERPPLGGVAR